MSRADELYAEYIRRKEEDEKSSATQALTSTTEPNSTPVNSLAFTAQPSISKPNVTPMAVRTGNIKQVAQNASATPEQRWQEIKKNQAIYASTATTPNAAKADQERYEAYKQNVNKILSGNQDDTIKNNYVYEEQLKYETEILSNKLMRQSGAYKSNGYDPNTGSFSIYGRNNRSLLNKTDEQRKYDETQALLKDKQDQLNTIRAQNEINRILENETVSSLVGALYDDEIDKENTVLNSLFNPSYAQGKSWSNAINAYTGKGTTASKAYEARQELIEMGYDPDKLLEQYSRNKSRVLTEGLTQSAVEFGKEHPVLGTVLSFPAMFASGVGMIEPAKALLTGRDADPNSPYFAALNIAQGLRGGASSDMSGTGEFFYSLGTTIGDMVTTRLASFGSGFGYAAIMASQAASSTAQTGAQKGYSAEHILINSLTSAALTTVCEKIGYDKIFSLKKVSTSKELFKNVLKGFFSEGLEEASEETLNALTQNITSFIFEGKTEISARIEELIAQGMSVNDAQIQAVEEIAEQVGQAFVLGGFSGGIISGSTSLPSYTDSVVNRVNSSLFPNQIQDVTTSAVDAENAQETPANPSLESTVETVDTLDENTATEEISAPNNEFDNLYDDVEQDVEQPGDEVSTTVDENGVEWIDFDDDTDFEALNDEIKTEYDTEEKADLTEKTEPYTSGNAAVDAMVNPNGRLDRKVTVDEQAEKRLVDTAAKLFNRKVRFIDTYNGADGYYDKETGEIVIARDSDKKYVTVFGHEFLHSLEGTHGYDTLTTFLRHNSPYIKNKVEEFGSWEALKQNKITEYENALGVKLTSEEAEYEIYADAIADEFFSDYKTMESLATQNRSLFTKLKQWFYTNVIKITDQTRVYGKNAAARKTYALMLRAEKAALNGVQSGEIFNKKYSIRNITSDDGKEFENAVVLDTDIFKNTKPRDWGKVLTRYVYDNLAGQQIIASDETVIEFARSNERVQKNGAKNSHKVIDKLARKKDRNSQLAVAHSKEIIEVLSQGVTNNEHSHQWLDENGWSHYTVTLMQTNGDVYEATINVAKSKDGRNILYDINQIKRTGHGAVSSESQRAQRDSLINPSSANSISDSAENVNGNISYSAKKPEIIDKLKADYGYSEASANNIYRAARTLKQNTGSKADIEQLTSAIVTSLENRRNGDIDSKNIERIAMMLAENAQAVNESYVSAYKPIMDYLKGTKISISEADISDLGDAFSYVKQRLFPTITLAKEGGTPVDTVFQELSAKFPNTFNADEITHPADQVKAIAGFIEEYRDNYYFKPYFEGDEAYTQLRDTVSELVNDNLIDSSTYLKMLTDMTNTYGELKNGIPQSTNGETRVRRGAASIYGTEAVQKSLERVERFVRDFVNGKHDYKVLRVGKEAMTYINKIKASDNVVETVKNEYSDLRRKLTDKNYRIQPDDIVKAAALNPLLGDILSDDDYVEYTMLVADVATTAGQIISSLKLISQFSGTQKLKAYHKKLDQINAKRAKNYQGEPDAYVVADENGQFKMPDDKTPKGFIELTVAKRQSKYPPIEIPTRLEAELAKAKTQAEIDKATDEINKYLAEQIHYSWFDKFGAWRYFAMLSNPKTAVRNTVGNIAMGATSRMKDVVAAAISALPSKYKEGSVQTTAVKTTKEARKAATRLLVESDNVFDLFSNQDKYTGRVNEFKQGEAKLNKIEQKIAERNPLLDTIFHKRSIQPTAMASTGRAIIDKPLGKLSDIQQKMLDDTLFKTLRAKSVLAQSITQAVKKGDIEKLDDFLAVALNGNTDNIDNATKIHYTQLFDTISKQAAKEGDEATFREDNEFANALNKFQSGDSKFKRVLSIAVEAIIPFKKTPANILKRGYEYSPVSLGINLVNGRVKLAKGEIDRNTYVNEIAKGLTGTGIFLLGALLSRVGLLNVGDEDEEDEAERKLLGGQNYSVNVGDGTYTIDFLSPAALPLFMGGKVYETVVSVLDGDEIKATEFMFDILQGVAEPMFAQTMLDGIDGAFEAISMNSAYDDTAGASFIALMNYCAESWVQQFVPAFFGGIARTADDTVRGYYNEPGKDEGLLDTLMVGIKKKLLGKTDETPAKLDMWGQPMSSGTLAERLLENFISPGYYEKNTEDEATLALHEFADDNDIPYTEILPKEVPKYYDFRGKRYNLTAEEYEYYAGVIGKARKEAVEKALVDGDDIEVSYRFYDIKLANDSGITFKDVTFTGNLADATNTYGWAPSGESEGYFEYEYSDEDNKKKAIKKTAATDEEFRQFLFDAYMLEVTEKAAFEAHKEITENRKNKKE